MARATRLYAALTAPTRPLGMASRQAGRTVSNLAPQLMPMWDKYMDDPENQKAFGEMGKAAGEGMSGLLGKAADWGGELPGGGSGFAGAMGSGIKTLQGVLPGLMERAGPMLGRMAPRVGAAVGSDILAQGGDMLGAPQEEWDPSIRRQNMMMAMQLPPEVNAPGADADGWTAKDGGIDIAEIRDEDAIIRNAGMEPGNGGIDQDFQANDQMAVGPRLKAILAGQPDPGGSEPSDMGAPSADPMEAALGKGAWGKLAGGAAGVVPVVGGVAAPVLEGATNTLHPLVAGADPLARARQGVLGMSGALDGAADVAGAAVKQMQGNSAPRFSPSQAASAPAPRMSDRMAVGPKLEQMLAKARMENQRQDVPAPGPDMAADAQVRSAMRRGQEEGEAQYSADQAFSHYLLPEARVYPQRGGSPPPLRDDSPAVGRRLSEVFAAARRAEEQPHIRAPNPSGPHIRAPNPSGPHIRAPNPAEENPNVSTYEDVDNWQQVDPYEWQFNKGRKRAGLSRALQRTWM